MIGQNSFDDAASQNMYRLPGTCLETCFEFRVVAFEATAKSLVGYEIERNHARPLTVPLNTLNSRKISKDTELELPHDNTTSDNCCAYSAGKRTCQKTRTGGSLRRARPVCFFCE